MNDYITLDGYKYKTVHGNWTPMSYRPRTVRQTADGNLDATFGPASFYMWKGMIIAAVTPDSGFGTPAQLRTSINKASTLSMTDHYGTAYTVAVVNGGDEVSRSPMWDGASNDILFNITFKGMPT